MRPAAFLRLHQTLEGSTVAFPAMFLGVGMSTSGEATLVFPCGECRCRCVMTGFDWKQLIEALGHRFRKNLPASPFCVSLPSPSVGVKVQCRENGNADARKRISNRETRGGGCWVRRGEQDRHSASDVCFLIPRRACRGSVWGPARALQGCWEVPA